MNLLRRSPLLRSDDDQLVPSTNHPMPGAHRLAANCLIFSDVKEMRDGFSQRLIIPMNSVTIPIWPRASDWSGRRSWWCSWKLELIDRGEGGLRQLQMGRHACHAGGALCIPFGEKSLHKKTEREKQGLDWDELDTGWAQ